MIAMTLEQAVNFYTEFLIWGMGWIQQFSNSPEASDRLNIETELEQTKADIAKLTEKIQTYQLQLEEQGESGQDGGIPRRSGAYSWGTTVTSAVVPPAFSAANGVCNVQQCTCSHGDGYIGELTNDPHFEYCKSGDSKSGLQRLLSPCINTAALMSAPPAPVTTPWVLPPPVNLLPPIPPYLGREQKDGEFPALAGALWSHSPARQLGWSLQATQSHYSPSRHCKGIVPVMFSDTKKQLYWANKRTEEAVHPCSANCSANSAISWLSTGSSRDYR